MRMLKSLIWRQIRPRSPRSLHTVTLEMEAPQQDIERSERIIDQESECTGGVVHSEVESREGEAVVAGGERASTEKENEVGGDNTE